MFECVQFLDGLQLMWKTIPDSSATLPDRALFLIPRLSSSFMLINNVEIIEIRTLRSESLANTCTTGVLTAESAARVLPKQLLIVGALLSRSIWMVACTVAVFGVGTTPSEAWIVSWNAGKNRFHSLIFHLDITSIITFSIFHRENKIDYAAYMFCIIQCTSNGIEWSGTRPMGEQC